MGEGPAPLTVVIVDDSMFMRLVLRRIFQSRGWQVVGEAENGIDAVKLAHELQPQLVTLDITMPALNGMASLPRILAASPDTRVVMVSAIGQQDKIAEALEAGARGFIAKPFKPDQVCRTIEQLLELAV